MTEYTTYISVQVRQQQILKLLTKKNELKNQKLSHNIGLRPVEVKPPENWAPAV